MPQRLVFVIAWLVALSLPCAMRLSTVAAQEMADPRQADESARREELTKLLTDLATVAERTTMGGRMGSAGQSPSDAIQLSRAVRLLATLPAVERYAELKQWMLPRGPGALPRGAMCFAPVEFPPEIFFSDVPIPDRTAIQPRSAAATDGSDGVIYFGELLVAAAAECGKLEELAATCKTLEQDSQMAEILSLLTVFACQGDSRLAQQARDVVTAWRQEANRPAPADLQTWPAYMVARAWMRREDFRDAGEQLADSLAASATATSQASLLSCLLRDLAWCRVQDVGGTLVPGADPGLALWHPGGYYYHTGTQAGTWPGWWVEHEGTVVHLSGPEMSPLYFDYPLEGEFELTVDGYLGAGAEAALQYDRFLYDPSWRGKKACLLTVGQREFVDCPNIVALPGKFSQLAIRVRPDLVRYVCDGTLMYEDRQPSPTTPWLALVGRATRRTAWCNFRLTGNPRIPPEVSLIHDQQMEGWMSPLYRESLPRQVRVSDVDERSSAASPLSLQKYAWYALSGVLHGRCMKTADRSRAVQSWLAYHRPLCAGDTLTYEFFYEPGEKMVYPSLGRTALVWEPDGVRLHWITDVPHMTIGGLSADNIATILESQRGPRPLPLMPGQWNQVTINMAENSAHVLLNGSEIYEHRLGSTDNRMFGLFHYANRTAVEVRHIVLRGDWPASLSAEQMAHPMARREGTESPENERARAALVDKSWLDLREQQQ